MHIQNSAVMTVAEFCDKYRIDRQGEAALTEIIGRNKELASILDNALPGRYNASRHPVVRGPALEPARDCPTTRCCA